MIIDKNAAHFLLGFSVIHCRETASFVIEHQHHHVPILEALVHAAPCDRRWKQSPFRQWHRDTLPFFQ